MPEEYVIVAHANEELTLVFNKKHSFAMRLDNGIEVSVHICLYTVTSNGEGAEQLIIK